MCILRRIVFYLINISAFALDFSEIANQVFSKYKRPFSVLYINPVDEEALYELSLYPSSFCVILENDPLLCEKYISFCEQHYLTHVVILQILPNNYVISFLKDLEAFDVAILGRNPLVYSEETLANLAQFIVISKENDYILDQTAVKLCVNQTYYNDFTLYEFDNSIKAFKYNNCLYPKKGYHILHSDLEKQQLYKTHEIRYVDWTPGINLVTYKLFLGVYPKMDTLYKKIQNLPWETHSDPQIVNIIVTGDDVHFIDNDMSLSNKLLIHKKTIIAYESGFKGELSLNPLSCEIDCISRKPFLNTTYILSQKQKAHLRNAKYHYEVILTLANLPRWEFLTYYYLISNGSTNNLNKHPLYNIIKQSRIGD